MSIELLKKLPTPTEIKADYPVTQKVARIKEERDEMIRKVFTGESDKFLVIIGPCSADNEEAVCEYINRLSRVQEEVADKLILIPRIYTNKPRTTGEGYKGILHQPDPEKKPDLLHGLIAIRKMHMRAIEESGLTAADELIQIFAIGIPASITNLMQSLGMTLMNRSLLPHGNDRVAAMGIIMKVNMIAVLILVGFAFGGQPLIGYNYGAKNRRRLKEILSFAYKFECGLGLLLTILLSLAARPMIRIFMKDNTIVSLGVPMLRMQLLGMVFVAIVLVTTCTFQSAGMARNAFLLSISRQGVIFAIVLAIASHTIGYQGILLSQAISDLLTAVLAIALYRTSVAKELHT